MRVNFVKYSATGNDFILLDNRDGKYDAINSQMITDLCHRRFGIGADGIIMLENSSKASFKMRYFNSDGSVARFCGNGARAIMDFTYNIFEDQINDCLTFEIEDGLIETKIMYDNVMVKMPSVTNVGQISLEEFGDFQGSLFVDTGVPHAVFAAELSYYDFDLNELYEKLNKRKDLFPDGVNVSVMENMGKDFIMLRTRERGVAEETYSCGTAAVAAAILTCNLNGPQKKIDIQVQGGKLRILFEDNKCIYLYGKIEKIFSGELDIND